MELPRQPGLGPGGPACCRAVSGVSRKPRSPDACRRAAIAPTGATDTMNGAGCTAPSVAVLLRDPRGNAMWKRLGNCWRGVRNSWSWDFPDVVHRFYAYGIASVSRATSMGRTSIPIRNVRGATAKQAPLGARARRPRSYSHSRAEINPDIQSRIPNPEYPIPFPKTGPHRPDTLPWHTGTRRGAAPATNGGIA